MSELDYYQILQLNRTANIDDIKKAFRRLSLKYHPTRNPSDITVCSDQFHQICESYEVLSNTQLAAIYDKYGSDQLAKGLENSNGVKYPGYKYQKNAFDIFERFYSEYLPYNEIFDDSGKLLYGSCFASINKLRKAEKLDDVHLTIECSIDELYNGCVKDISYETKRRTIEIQPGFKNGHVVEIEEECGQSYEEEYRKIYIKIKELPHTKYSRKENHLIYKHDINLLDALNSVPWKFKTLDGRILNISIDEIITPKTVKVVENEGMPIYDEEEEKLSVINTKHGKLFIVFNILFPKKLNEDLKQKVITILNG